MQKLALFHQVAIAVQCCFDNDCDFALEQENDGNDDYHHSREHVAICAAQSS